MEFNDNDLNFTVLDDNGNEIICDVISLLQDEKTNELFIFYTDYTLNEKDQFNTYLSQLIEDKGTYRLKRIESKARFSELLKDAKTLYGKALDQLLEQ